MLNDTRPQNVSVQALDKLKADILRLYSQGLTWRQIGERYCISHAMAQRLATQPGYLPANRETRQRLGLEPYRWDDLPVDQLRYAIDHREEFINA